MIRYRQLARVVLNVRDVDTSAVFYRDVVGLLPADEVGRAGRGLRAGSGSCDVVLSRGEPGLKRLVFELESEPARDALAAALQRAGVGWREGECDGGAALRISEPHTGASIDFVLGRAAVPVAPAPGLLRLGHVVLEAQDDAAAVRFFTDVLNFQVSDRIDGAITFLRCFPNPLHHSLGIGRGRNALHHVNFMTPHIDDVGRALWRLRRAGVAIVNGPGRHLPSGSLFLYFLDPDGLTLEFSAGMEEFPETGARAPRVLPREPNSFDLWDGPVDPRKGAIGAIEHDPQ